MKKPNKNGFFIFHYDKALRLHRHHRRLKKLNIISKKVEGAATPRS